MLLCSIGIARVAVCVFNLTLSLPKLEWNKTKEKWSSLSHYYYIIEVLPAIIIAK